jgi:hypothetical protein
MRNPPHRSLIALLIVITGAASYFFAYKLPGSEATIDEGVPLTAENVDIGTQPETQHYVHHFRIKNLAGESIRIARLGSTCDCADLSPDRDITVPANESVEIAATLRLQARSDCSGLNSSDRKAIPIWAYYSRNGKEEKASWAIECTILQSIVPKEPIVSLGMQSIQLPDLIRTTEILASEEVQRIDCEGSLHWSLQIDEMPSRAPRVFAAKLYWKGERKPAKFDELISLRPIDREGKSMSVKQIRCIGEWVEDVISVPRVVAFGRRRLGEIGEEAIRFRSLTGAKFEIESRKTDDKTIAIERHQDKQGPFFLIKKQFDRDGEQSSNAMFEMQCSGPEGKKLQNSVTVLVTYCGYVE